MRKLLSILSLMTLILSSCHRVADGEHILNIYITSDVHGQYFGRYYLDDSVKPNSLSKVSSLMLRAREADPEAILIDGGDNLQGDNAAFYYNRIDTVNYLKYDAIVVGNHDIEAGHPVYDRARPLFDAPLLAANAIATEGANAGKPYFEEYTVVKRNGLKVAIIGATNPCVTNWVTEPLYHGLEFKPIAETMQPLVDRVRAAEKPDFVIVAVHSGSGEQDIPATENCALYLAQNLKGVDVVTGGHDHRSCKEIFEKDGGTTVYLNPGARAFSVGHASFTLTYNKGRKVAEKVEMELCPMEDLQNDPAFDAAFEADYQAVKQFTLRPICEMAAPFELGDALKGPSAYMKLLADLQLAVSGADITFVAPLSSAGTIRQGTLVYNDLTKIYPFENKLFTINLTGSQIKSYLETSYDRWINRTGPAYCYDSAFGIKYNVYKRCAKGERVEIISMEDGSPFEPEKVYSVAITSYRAMGGDGMLAEGAGLDVSNPDAYITNRFDELRDLLFDYLSAAGTYQPAVNTNWNYIE